MQWPHPPPRPPAAPGQLVLQSGCGSPPPAAARGRDTTGATQHFGAVGAAGAPRQGPGPHANRRRQYPGAAAGPPGLASGPPGGKSPAPTPGAPGPAVGSKAIYQRRWATPPNNPCPPAGPPPPAAGRGESRRSRNGCPGPPRGDPSRADPTGNGVTPPGAWAVAPIGRRPLPPAGSAGFYRPPIPPAKPAGWCH